MPFSCRRRTQSRRRQVGGEDFVTETLIEVGDDEVDARVFHGADGFVRMFAGVALGFIAALPAAADAKGERLPVTGKDEGEVNQGESFVIRFWRLVMRNW